MIEENLQVKKVEAKIYPPIPENIYQVELLDINIKSVAKYKKPNELEDVLDFQFTVLDGKDKAGEDLRCRNLWRNFVPTYLYIGKNGKNILYQILEAILDRELTQEEEISSIDTNFLNELIGKQCRVIVKNKKVNDKIYSNIESFLPMETLMPQLTAEEKTTLRTLTQDTQTLVKEAHQALIDAIKSLKDNLKKLDTAVNANTETTTKKIIKIINLT